jgi:hypothetical protein
VGGVLRVEWVEWVEWVVPMMRAVRWVPPVVPVAAGWALARSLVGLVVTLTRHTHWCPAQTPR